MDRVLKKSFLVDKILKEEAEIIKQMQLEVVRDWHLEDHTGTLKKMLKGYFSIEDFDGGPRLTLSYVKHIRFLDMPWVTSRRGGLLLYNRIVFGRMYNNTSQRVRQAYRDSLKEEISELVQDAVEPLHIEE